ncbi:MAG: hypothetical protein RBS39_00580 [Phycisphaerales bacterium]|jgi:hypothetical protein|nr:hypothetical protein [Phycisphaerales bacterium]
MRTLILGPTMLIRSNDEPPEISARLVTWADGAGYDLTQVGEHFQIAIPRERRRFWSPWLTLEVRGVEGGSEVFGRFNPSPAIWTGYMLASLALLTIAAGGAMWGLAELTIGAPPRGMWAIPACGVALAAMWGVSGAGQRLAGDQMRQMRQSVEDGLGRDRPGG